MRILKMSIVAVVCVGSIVSAQVTKDSIKTAVPTYKSRTFAFDNTVVVGYGDNPTTTYVPGNNVNDTTEIRLERSFKNELTSNVDKETVERMN